MDYTALIIVLVLVLIFFIWAFLKIFTWAPNKKRPMAAAEASPAINIQVRREEDGIHLVIPDIVPAEDGPEAIFPDIINDVAPETYGLTAEFWRKVAIMPEIEDPEERERLAQALADAGKISRDDIPLVALLVDADAAASGEEKEHDDKPQETQHQATVSSEEVHDEKPTPEPEPIPEPEPLPPPNNKETTVPDSQAAVTASKRVPEEDFANHEFHF